MKRFLLLCCLVWSIPPPVNSQETQLGWQVAVDHDLMGADSSIVAISFATATQGTDNNIIMAIRCNLGEKVEVLVVWGEVIRNRFHMGETRYDDGMVISTVFGTNSDGSTSFLNPQLVKTMPNFRRLAVAVTTSRNRRLVAAFSLIGVTPAINRIRSACPAI